MWLNIYWNVTERLLNVAEWLLKCDWTVTEIRRNGYLNVTESYRNVTELLLKCNWTVTEM